MKKIILATLISGAMSASAMAAPVSAGQGTVTFTGSIIEAACGIAPESTDQTIDLGQVASAQLKDGGASRPVPFSIELVDCDTSINSIADVTFTGGQNPARPGSLAIQGTAAGAGVVITGLDGAPVTLDGSAGAGKINLQDGDNSLMFSAFLQGNPTGTPTPGEFTALANFTMQYE